jgi:pimeloyl-ACP methyl ester carboxylesterase
MTPDETRAAGRLAATAVAGTVTHIEQTHLGIANRPFRLTGPASAPVRVVHDAVSRLVYGTVRAAMFSAGLAASELLTAAARSRPAEPAGSTVKGNLSMAALNAAIGHTLQQDGNPLAIRMALRANGRDVPLRRETLDTAFPAPTAKLAVFVHGLMETEDAWRLHASRHYDDPRVCYGTRLADDFGYTPVYLRYNTGLHVSENGRGLARLLADLVEAWPSAVDEVMLVGHSMGGLVARSACHYGYQSGAPWVPLVRHVFCLATPHLGAPLERGAGYLGWALAKLTETQALATLVNGRSVGIKDLRFGYLLDDEWRDCDADTCLQDHRSDVPLLPTANYYVIAATLARDSQSPSGRLIGDLLVQPASATGRHPHGRHIPFPVGNGRQFGGLHHLHLLNHPDVYHAMRTWLQPTTFPV